MMTPYLFVYGSLMSGITSPIATYLKTNSRFMGAGWVQGRLYDIGNYPGLIADNATKAKVVGHIFQLRNLEEMLPNLDHYECIGPNFPEPHQYRRAIISVKTAHETLSCWAYLYNWDTKGLALIESGNYLQYFRDNQRYQDFVRSLNDFSRNG
ncbi:MAG: gamma-glutamylcyclotransferase family protein [Bacteroidota bacterium]